MKPIEFASVSLKMLGIYCFLKTIPIIQSIVDTKNLHNLKVFDSSANFSIVFTGSIVSLILFILFGICLLLFGDKIAAKIIPDKNYSKTTQTIESKNLQAIAISVVGLLIMALAIPKIMQFKRIEQILGQFDMDVSEESSLKYMDYLKRNIEFPCQLTGIEDFPWEEYYVFGPGNRKEYEKLKSNNHLIQIFSV